MHELAAGAERARVGRDTRARATRAARAVPSRRAGRAGRAARGARTASRAARLRRAQLGRTYNYTPTTRRIKTYHKAVIYHTSTGEICFVRLSCNALLIAES